MNPSRVMHRMSTITALAVLAAMLIGCAQGSTKERAADSTTPAASEPKGGPTPGFNNEIPEGIMTPDTVETRIGTLEFFDGIPTKETAALVYDNLDLMRGVEAFMHGIPATSLEAIRLGSVAQGAKSSNQVILFEKLMDSNSLFLTGNTDTVYAVPILDLKKDGPTVV